MQPACSRHSSRATIPPTAAAAVVLITSLPPFVTLPMTTTTTSSSSSTPLAATVRTITIIPPSPRAAVRIRKSAVRKRDADAPKEMKRPIAVSACGPRMLIVLVHILAAAIVRGIGSADAAEESRFDQNMSLHPYFDFDVVRNVTARVGQTAFLNCRVEQLGDKSVSWIRKRDLHILTAGILTYTSDERFQVIRPENSDHWTLQIKFPQMRDTGIYECQVNTEPKMSMAFRLNVVEAKAEIHGPRDLYVKMGSLVTLSCKVSQGPHELGTIHWYRGSIPLDPRTIPHPNEAIVYEHPGRISIDTEWTDSLRSRLKVKSAKLSDSGNYSCLPTNAEGDSVTVHIINGEHPAAMQRGAGHRLTPQPAVLFAMVVFVAASAIRMLLLWRQQQHEQQQPQPLQHLQRQYSLQPHPDHQPENIRTPSAAQLCTQRCNAPLPAGTMTLRCRQHVSASITTDRLPYPAEVVALSHTTSKTTNTTTTPRVTRNGAAPEEAVSPVMPAPSQSSSSATSLPHVWPGSVIDSLCGAHVLHAR